MKLLLTSSGLTTPEMISAVEDLCNKKREDISVVIINEASKVETGDTRWIARHYNDVSTMFGGLMEIVDLVSLSLDEIVTKINSCDVIYVLGGNSDFLMKTLEESGLAARLPGLLEDHVYIGSSAGAMVLGRRPKTSISTALYHESESYEVEKYMELFDFVLYPHLNDEKFPDVTSENILRVHDDERNFIAIEREQAIVINNEDISFLGGEVLRSE